MRRHGGHYDDRRPGHHCWTGDDGGPGDHSGWPATTAAPSGETKTLKIGTIMPQTGPWPSSGLSFTRAWDIYAEDVNNAGGVKIGNDTYMIEFIHEDSKGSAEGASTAASKLVNQDKVNLVIGAILESEMAAIDQVTQAAGVLYAQRTRTSRAPAGCGARQDRSRSGRSSTTTRPSRSISTTSWRPIRRPRR